MMMTPRRVPRLNLSQLTDTLRLLLSGNVKNGPHLNEFESEMASYLGVKHAISTCSGRSALELALEGHGIGRGDGIIVPAYTLIDLIVLLKDKGIIPQLVDIEESSFNLNPELVEKAITPQTKAILATHIMGLPCDLQKLREICQRRGLVLIEDCAHALGAKVGEQRVGSFGESAIFSFQLTKNINTFGGGLLATNNDQLAQWARVQVATHPYSTTNLLKKMFFNCLEYLLIHTPFYGLFLIVFCFETSSRLFTRFYLALGDKVRAHHLHFTNLQALMALRQLRRLDFVNNERNKRAQAMISLLKELPQIKPQFCSRFSNGRTYHYLVVSIPPGVDLFKLRSALFFKGVDAGIYNEITDNCSSEGHQVIGKLYPTLLQLPLSDKMTGKEQKKVLLALQEVLGQMEREEYATQCSSR